MGDQQELINRWDAFLKKIEARFSESLQHAEAACLEQLVETDHDYETVYRSWQGMKAQIHELIQKIDAVWHGKVRPEMQAVGDFYNEEGYKASDTNDRLIDELFRFERILEGKLSQQFYDHAIQIANKKASCSQCDADLEIKKDIFRAQYITCGYCNAVNTVEPETKFIKIGWGIIDNIAALKAQPEYDAMEKASDTLSKQRKTERDDSHWSAYENAYYAYWEKYFNERIKLNSDAKERYEADMQRKRTEFEAYKRIQTS
ncbi:Hypothetical protein I595_958 [Croceitalea dokdonensis DOKDO 023]|uniref:Uncharacterized protein n=1 Tax=Croceitalea dokdonensis DOKDO 023 TaxID=1300341 RepID=A0A0N8H469_9FLAO|nr:hypothetical protein [Croceitalea dokdonensis]KPM32540.1 Hypothetical protein I595_958 [Croceitalea dokdonensis DOKDO 023]